MRSVLGVALIVLMGAGLGCAAKTPCTIEGSLQLTYDDALKKPDDKFRMALIIVPEKGFPILDFFKGIPTPGDKMVGNGNAFLPVPKLSKVNLKPIPNFPVPEALEAFNADFPELMEKDFSLTFKEFSNHRYLLENPPRGKAYVWLQTGFDGNRVTQCPFLIKLEPKKHGSVRLDITLDDWTKLFFFL